MDILYSVYAYLQEIKFLNVNVSGFSFVDKTQNKVMDFTVLNSVQYTVFRFFTKKVWTFLSERPFLDLIQSYLCYRALVSL